MSGPFQATSVPNATPMWLVRLGKALTGDYCRRYDRFLRWARNPLAVLILATITSAFCGFCLHPQGFILSYGLGALIVAGVAWPWLNVLGLRGILSFEKSRSREGEAIKTRLSLFNRCPWGAWGLAIQAGLGESSDAGLSHAVGWRKTEICWDFIPACRGIYPEQTPRIASGFPFGLSFCSRMLKISDSILVWPRTFAVGPIPRVTGGYFSEGTAPRNRPGGSGDFLGVRPYRWGDSLRRVHWPQTARLGHMVVCELESSAVPRVQVVLDAHPAKHAGKGPDSSREWAIRVAASFVEAWIGQGAEVELVVGGLAIPACGGGSITTRRACLLDALARIRSDVVITLPELLDQPACRRFSTGLRVVVATDLAVSNLDSRPSKGPCERFVILRATAFDPTGKFALVEPLPIRPWVWIDGPTRVPQQVRHAWKEVVLGS